MPARRLAGQFSLGVIGVGEIFESGDGKVGSEIVGCSLERTYSALEPGAVARLSGGGELRWVRL